MEKKNNKKWFSLIFVFMLLFFSTNRAFAAEAYHINGKAVRYTDYCSSSSDGWHYANKIYYKIWGHHFTAQFNDSSNMLRELPDDRLTLTVPHLKEYVSKAPLGSAIRICNTANLHSHDGYISGKSGHVQIIVQKDNNGFTVVEGGLPAGSHCREKYYSWEEFCSADWLGGQYAYIKYIKWPGAAAYKPHLASEEEAHMTGFGLLQSAQSLLSIVPQFFIRRHHERILSCFGFAPVIK